MNTEFTYNPAAQLSLRDKLSNFYYGSAAGQFAVELTFFATGCAVIAVAAVAFTA